MDFLYIYVFIRIYTKIIRCILYYTLCGILWGFVYYNVQKIVKDKTMSEFRSET